MTRTTDDSQKSYESFWFLFLAGIYTVITLVLFLCFWAENGVSKSNDFNFYVLGWAFFVPLGLVLAALTEKIGSVYFKTVHSFGFIASFLNFIFLLYELCPATWESCPYWVGLSEFLLLQCGIVLIARGFQLTGKQLSAFLEESLTALMGCAFVFWVLFISQSSIIFITNASIYNWLLCVFFVWVLYKALSNENKAASRIVSTRARTKFFQNEFFYYLMALFLILFLVIDPNFEFDRYHYSFFLGPLADFRAGRSFLVNINSQYGVLIFYFLSIFFKILPLGFKSLCFVLTFLYVAQYFSFYFITRQLFKTRYFSFICLIVLFVMNYFATSSRMTIYPSVGPLRFGFICVLLVLVILRNQHSEYKKYFFVAEAAVSALAIFWSFEVCVYTVPAYLGLILYESIDRKTVSDINWGSLFQRFFYLTGFSLFLLTGIYGDVYYRTQSLPHWSYYFDYIFMYKNGFGMLPVPALGGWWIIAAILLISTIIIWGSLTKWKNKKLPAHFNAIVLLTFYGVFQLLYYWGRAHENNIFMVSLPSVLLGAYWLCENRKKDIGSFVPQTVRKTVFVLSLVGLGVYLQFFIPDVAYKLRQNIDQVTSAPQSLLSAAMDLPRDDDFAKRADALIEKYSGSKKQIIYLFGDKGLEVSLYTHRMNAFPYNDIAQVCFCPPALQRVVDYNPQISVGDYTYVSDDINSAYYVLNSGRTTPSPLEKMILYKLTHEYIFKLVEQQKGIAVFQVLGRRPIHS
jgi:hypothetical protein